MAGLFTPLSTRNLRVANRIVMAPMATNMATARGEVTPRLISHYRERAEAGVGLIIIEHTYVSPGGRYSPKQLAVDRDSLVSGLSELTRALHTVGVPVILQITHAGSRTTEEVLGTRPVAPSSLPVSKGAPTPRPLFKSEIPRIIEDFSAGARRAKDAGFDGVEIHGAHGFLLSAFLSPAVNHRDDDYGGSAVNRLRLPLEVVTAARQAVGPDFPLLYRLGAEDHVNGGLQLKESLVAAKKLVEAGIDLMDVSGGLCGSRPPNLDAPGFFVPAAEKIKEVVPVPVIGVGGIKEPRFADSLIEEGRIDLVAVGRALLADPSWAAKAAVAMKSSK